MHINLDNSKRGCYASCPRKYYYQYVRHLQPRAGGEALTFGKVYHAFHESFRNATKQGLSDSEKMRICFKHGLDTWNKEMSFGLIHNPEDYRNFENCYLIFMKYLEHYGDDIVPLETEYYFSEPILSSGEDTVSFAGKIDTIGRLKEGENIAIFDDKTTGYSLGAILEQARRSAQLIGYCWIASRHKNFPTSTAYINAVYCKPSKKTGELKVEHSRGVYIFSDHDTIEWHRSLMLTAEDVLKSHKANYFPMQFDSCYGKYGVCKFLELCSMPSYNESYIQEHFIEREWKIYE